MCTSAHCIAQLRQTVHASTWVLSGFLMEDSFYTNKKKKDFLLNSSVFIEIKVITYFFPLKEGQL